MSAKGGRISFVLFAPNSPFTTLVTLGSRPHHTLPGASHLLFCQWATLGSHPFSSVHIKARSVASLPEVAHVRMLTGKLTWFWTERRKTEQISQRMVQKYFNSKWNESIVVLSYIFIYVLKTLIKVHTIRIGQLVLYVVNIAYAKLT